MSLESDDAINQSLAKGFANLPKKVINKIMKTHLKKYSKELEGDAKRLAPTETRELKNKIKARVGKRSTIAANYQVGVNATEFKEFSPKASIQEYGSIQKNIPEKSFLRKPFDNKAEQIAKKLSNDIIKDIETELGK